MLIVAPATVGAGHDVDGSRLAREHRLVDRRLSLDDDAVGRDLLARADDEHVADGELADRNRDLRAVAQDASLLRPELEQGANRRAGAPLRPRLEVAPERGSTS